jgi:hypothetical protein
MKSNRIFFSAAVACASLFAASESSAATVRVNVSNVTQLYNAFRDADARPSDWFEVQLAQGVYPLVCSADSDALTNKTSGALKLRAGKVRLLGAQTEGWAQDFMIDGGLHYAPNPNNPNERILKMCSSFFRLEGSSSQQPQLEIRGVKLANGQSRDSDRQPISVVRGSLTINHSQMEWTRTARYPGGAVFASEATVNMFGTTILDAAHSASGPGRCTTGIHPVGGAFYFEGSRATIQYSTIMQSSSCRGGAINFQSSSSSHSLRVEESTIGFNLAWTRGGGILASGPGKVTLLFNTIAKNVSGRESSSFMTNEPRYGGGIAFSGYTGALTMYGNIIADNVNEHPFMPNQPAPDGNDCYTGGTFTSTRTLGTQLVGQRGNCAFLPASPLVGTSSNPVDPQFFGLVSMSNAWGGDLEMFQVEPTSPAMNAFPGTWPLTCPTVDQAGNPRVTPCDLGSVETL